MLNRLLILVHRGMCKKVGDRFVTPDRVAPSIVYSGVSTNLRGKRATNLGFQIVGCVLAKTETRKTEVMSLVRRRLLRPVLAVGRC